LRESRPGCSLIAGKLLLNVLCRLESRYACAYLGIVAMALPIFLRNYALQYYDASEAGLFINLAPVVSVISAMLLLGERVNAGQFAAGGVVILGVLLSSGFGIVKKKGSSGRA